MDDTLNSGGNPVDTVGDHYCVDCARCMECFSAQLDSEETETEREAIDTHLTVCATCRRFADNAARVTRLARTVVAANEFGIGEPIIVADREWGLRAVVEAAQWCGCPCCRRLVVRLAPPSRSC
jgi:predicted anti-sigma-YlaC factor YlaD